MNFESLGSEYGGPMVWGGILSVLVSYAVARITGSAIAASIVDVATCAALVVLGPLPLWTAIYCVAVGLMSIPAWRHFARD